MSGRFHCCKFVHLHQELVFFYVLCSNYLTVMTRKGTWQCPGKDIWQKKGILGIIYNKAMKCLNKREHKTTTINSRRTAKRQSKMEVRCGQIYMRNPSRFIQIIIIIIITTTIIIVIIIIIIIIIKIIMMMMMMTGETRDQRKNRDLRKLGVAQTSVKYYQLKLVWKTCKM